jgi:putative hydrolase of the HAD superfamily
LTLTGWYKTASQTTLPLSSSLSKSHPRLAACVQELFATQRQAITGERSIEECIAHLPARWNSRGDASDIMRAWTTGIEVDATVMGIVRALREDGVPCFLGSNQGRTRARYMSETLNYKLAFDREFYSCDIAAAKPDHRFFEIVLRQVSLPAASVLFIDDNAANVTAAREVGLKALHLQYQKTSERFRLICDFLHDHGIEISNT